MTEPDTRSFDAVAGRLTALDAKVQRSIVRKGVRAGAKIILAAARSAAPVLTGLTRDNVKMRSAKPVQGRTAMTVGVNKKDFTGPAFYAAFVLYGHKTGRRKARGGLFKRAVGRLFGTGRKQIPADNWLGRAFDQTQDGANETTMNTIGELIEGE